MNRIDREVVSRDEQYSILSRCGVIRIAFHGEPYVVPVSFGCEKHGDEISVYVHGAQDGEKLMRMRANPEVCLEADLYYGVEQTEHGITTRYESVIAKGIFEEISEPDEKARGLRCILEHYHYEGYPLDRCRGFDKTCVFRIRVGEMTGKRNLPAKTGNA